MNNFLNIEAEQATLGMLLLNPNLLDDLSEIISCRSFVNIDHSDIYRAVTKLGAENKTIDPITVMEVLEAEKSRVKFSYLNELIENTASTTNAKAYARILRDAEIKRQVFASTSEIVRTLNERKDMSASDAVEFAQCKMMELGDVRGDVEFVEMNAALKSYVDHLDYLFEKGDVIDGLATKLTAVDGRVDGYKPGNLVIIAGRPGQGKTTLALNYAKSFSVHQKKRGLYISLEMGVKELMQKLIASVGSIPQKHLKKPSSVNNDFWAKLQSTIAICKDSPLSIVDLSSLHINQLKSYVRKAHKRTPLDYVIIDHTHLMEGDGDNKTQKIGSISRGLKQLAKELNIPIFALAQLNREVEKRGNKRPILSDLRESGDIEADADIVQFVYRDEYYNEQTDNPNTMEIITAKFRDGESGTDYLKAEMFLSKIADLDGMYMQSSYKSSMADSL